MSEEVSIWKGEKFELNLQLFRPGLLAVLDSFDSLLEEAADLGSAKIESTHILIALSRLESCCLVPKLEKIGLSREGWISGLASCAEKSLSEPPPGHLIKDSFSSCAIAVLEHAELASGADGKIDEIHLLAAALRGASERVKELSETANVPLEEWALEMEDSLIEVDPITPFLPSGDLDSGAFSIPAFNLVEHARREAEDIGAATVDVRHLLLSLMEMKSGPLHYPLHSQKYSPRGISECIRLNLGDGVFQGGRRTQLDQSRKGFHIALQILLQDAGERAARERADVIQEIHLARELVEGQNAGSRILEIEGVDRESLARVLAGMEYEEVDSGGVGRPDLADIETVHELLKARLVGQDSAIERVLPYIQRMRFGFKSPGRPVGVFLFCGQSGCGKTEMAKEIARAVFGSEDALIFLEMGQFQKSESMNIFVGAPPGYVGYGQGKLTNGLRDQPKAVILFDEIEKATASVFDSLLRFLDEGKIDDPAGPVRDGSGCIVVLTSNVGARQLAKLSAELKGEPARDSIVRRKMRSALEGEDLRPEFLNRVDEIVLFETLTGTDYTEIARRVLKSDLDRLREDHGIVVEWGDELADAIGAYCDHVSEGARLVRRMVQSVVVTPVIDFVLKLQSHSTPIRVKVTALVDIGNEMGEPRGVVSLSEAF